MPRRSKLCLFDRRPARDRAHLTLPEYTDEVWHGYLPEAAPGHSSTAIGSTAPTSRRTATASIRTSCCSTPMPSAFGRQLRWSDAHFGYRVGSPRDDLSFDRRDSARVMPKCVVVDPAFTWGDDRPPRMPLAGHDHLRGPCQRLHHAHPGRRRAAARHLRRARPRRRSIDHLQALGVTAVELLPVHAFFDDRHLVEKGLRNYWGYNTIGFFAPEPRYLGRRQRSSEFKIDGAALHDAGIEVILDVVYNHTGEGNHLGPDAVASAASTMPPTTGCVPDKPRYYDQRHRLRQHAQPAHPRVLQMVMDSPALLGRGDACRRLPLRSCHHPRPRARRLRSAAPASSTRCARTRCWPSVKLIAEPWDVGPGGYQRRRLPAGLVGMERPLSRHGAPLLARRRRHARRARRRAHRLRRSLRPRRAPALASVNFITAHDGFTLHDLVTYNDKHNEANGEDNRDGYDDNFSWNCGVEGPTDDPEIIALRERQTRNLLATLLLSQGMPMLLAGDEFGRTQQRQQQCLLPGQRDRLARLDAAERPNASACCLHRAADRAAPAASRAAPRRNSSTASSNRRDGAARHRLVRADGTEMTPERWQDGSPAASALPQRPGRRDRAPTDACGRYF